MLKISPWRIIANHSGNSLVDRLSAPWFCRLSSHLANQHGVGGRCYSSHTRKSDANFVSSRFTVDIFTLPNVITVGRILCTPFVSYLMVSGDHRSALAAFAAVSVSDFIDGWIARRFNKRSLLGTYLDPLADKVLIGTMTCTLSYMDILPIWASTIVIGRDILLVLGTAAVRCYTMDCESLTLKSFFDVSTHPTHEIRPSTLSKVNTMLQLGWVSAGMLSMSFDIPNASILSAMTTATIGTTVASGFDYLLYSGKFLRRLKSRS